MSIGNLLSQDIGNMTVPCAVSGAIGGLININIKRLDNMVFCHLPAFTSTASNVFNNIIITPITPLSTNYLPSDVNVLQMFPINNSANVLGFFQVSVPFIVTIPSGNYNSTSGFNEQVFFWSVNDYQ